MSDTFGGSVEIERDVTIEDGGNLEVGFLAGTRTAADLPHYSEHELKHGLGGRLTSRIQRLFRNPSGLDPTAGRGSSGRPSRS